MEDMLKKSNKDEAIKRMSDHIDEDERYLEKLYNVSGKNLELAIKICELKYVLQEEAKNTYNKYPEALYCQEPHTPLRKEN